MSRPHAGRRVDAGRCDALRDAFVDVAFIGTNGLTVARGLTTPDQAEAMVKRAMVASARRIVVLGDHTKVGTDHFAQFGALDDIDTAHHRHRSRRGGRRRPTSCAPAPRLVQA